MTAGSPGDDDDDNDEDSDDDDDPDIITGTNKFMPATYNEFRRQVFAQSEKPKPVRLSKRIKFITK